MKEIKLIRIKERVEAFHKAIENKPLYYIWNREELINEINKNIRLKLSKCGKNNKDLSMILLHKQRKYTIFYTNRTLNRSREYIFVIKKEKLKITE